VRKWDDWKQLCATGMGWAIGEYVGIARSACRCCKVRVSTCP
jgi:hypothetical protein